MKALNFFIDFINTFIYNTTIKRSEKMREKDKQLWKAYHSGAIDRELTEDEKKEIRACDLAMHLLIDTASLYSEIKFNGLENMTKLYNLKKTDQNLYYHIVLRLSDQFQIEVDVMEVKIQYLAEKEQRKESKKEKIKKKFLKLKY